jgi:hypothetical protein
MALLFVAFGACSGKIHRLIFRQRIILEVGLFQCGARLMVSRKETTKLDPAAAHF